MRWRLAQMVAWSELLGCVVTSGHKVALVCSNHSVVSTSPGVLAVAMDSYNPVHIHISFIFIQVRGAVITSCFCFICERPSSFKMFPAKVKGMTDEQAEKVREMSQTDIPIQQRRALYNGLARRMAAGKLKPGLVEKYNSAASSRKERFALLKEFIIDEDMSAPQLSKVMMQLCFVNFVSWWPNMFTVKERCGSGSVLHSVRPLRLASATTTLILQGWTLNFPQKGKLPWTCVISTSMSIPDHPIANLNFFPHPTKGGWKERPGCVWKSPMVWSRAAISGHRDWKDWVYAWVWWMLSPKCLLIPLWIKPQGLSEAT